MKFDWYLSETQVHCVKQLDVLKSTLARLPIIDMPYISLVTDSLIRLVEVYITFFYYRHSCLSNRIISI